VEKLHTTACKQTKEKLKKIFSTHGIPRRLESDNGPPFNFIDFANFAIEEGFEHHEITPLHPRANGEAEAFMKVLNKIEQIANLAGGPFSSSFCTSAFASLNLLASLCISLPSDTLLAPTVDPFITNIL
jgi:hypothetical protein